MTSAILITAPINGHFGFIVYRKKMLFKGKNQYFAVFEFFVRLSGPYMGVRVDDHLSTDTIPLRKRY